MKKLLALVLTFALVLSTAVCVLADFVDYDEAPTSYVWLTADSTTTPSVTFQIDPELLMNQEYTLAAKVMFGEDVVDNGGLAYVNWYSYDDPANYNDFSHLLNFQDFGASNGEDITLGEWTTVETTFNPYSKDYANGNSSTAITGASECGLLTISFGFYLATGTISVANIVLRANNETVTAIDFSAGFDPEGDDVFTTVGVTADTEEINWGVVVPEDENEGNIAIGATCTIVGGPNTGDPLVAGGNSTYCSALTDGIASADKEYSSKWFGFLCNTSDKANSVNEEVEGTTYHVGRAIVDLGEAKEFNCVRTHVWDAAGDSGICSPSEIIVYTSTDGENYEYYGDCVLGEAGTVYWAATPEADVTARYIKVEYLYNGGVWLFVNEIQAISPEVIEESSEEAPAEESEDAPVDPTPATGDAGFVALAIVSVIALGGVVIAKKVK